MCWALYLASDTELPLVPWVESAHGFCTLPLSDYEICVTSQFSLPNALYLGSHQGCGCGFMSDDSDGVEESMLRRKTMACLADYLNAALQKGGRLEMYFCWEGDQGSQPVGRKHLTVSAFKGSEFPLGEKEFAVVSA